MGIEEEVALESKRLLQLSNLRLFANSSFALSLHAEASRRGAPSEPASEPLLRSLREHSLRADEAIRHLHIRTEELQHRLDVALRTQQELEEAHAKLQHSPVAAVSASAASLSDEVAADLDTLFSRFLPKFFPSTRQPHGTVALAELLHRLYADPDWISVDQSIWPPHLELLLRSGIIIQHPKNAKLIRSAI